MTPKGCKSLNRPDSVSQREIQVDKKYNFSEICYDVRGKRFNLHETR